MRVPLDRGGLRVGDPLVILNASRADRELDIALGDGGTRKRENGGFDVDASVEGRRGGEPMRT